MRILKADKISAGYRKKPVIQNISFQVVEGDFIGIIGPNGAGKTTLFRALTGALSLLGGNVFYNGRDIKRMKIPEFAREVAVMPQIAEISPGFTVEEFVFLARFSHTGRFGAMAGADRDAVNAAFIMTGTGDLRRRRLSELSGGERQMVFLAQCLAQQPRLLLLDEPTAHLDIAHQVKIMDVLKKLNSQGGLTTIAILHDLNLASEYCRKLILLDNGRIYREGVVDEILTYQNIEAVYKTAVVVEKNPFSKKPYIMLTSDQLDKRNEGAIPSVPNVTHYLGDTSGPRSVA